MCVYYLMKISNRVGRSIFFFIFFLFLYPLFSLEKKGILISCQSWSVVRPSVRTSVTFLVNVSSPKPLAVATSNFVVE